MTYIDWIKYFQTPDKLSIRLRCSLYGLKQSGRMWYNHLSEYLTGQGYVNNELYPYVFIKKSHSGFAIVAVYVDDMNLIETLEKLARTVAHLKSEFETKDLGKTQYCLDLEIEHRLDEILVHQSNYTQKVLRRFNKDKKAFEYSSGRLIARCKTRSIMFEGG